MTKKIIISILIIMWMTVIFMLSSQHGKESKTLSGKVEAKVEKVLPQSKNIIRASENIKISFVRKLAHLYLYIGFGFLCYLFFKAFDLRRPSLASVLFGFIYACTDEIHQIYVPGREGKFADVSIDLIGITAGILLALLAVLSCNAIKKYF